MITITIKIIKKKSVVLKKDYIAVLVLDIPVLPFFHRRKKIETLKEQQF